MNRPPMGRRAWAVAGAAAGLLLFAVVLRAVDTRAIVSSVVRVGPGFAIVLLLGGVRQVARAIAWSRCSERPGLLPVRSTLGAIVVGEALGNLTPLGLLASEPAKVMWVRGHLSGIEASAALAVETLVYSAFVVAVLIAGSVAVLSSVALPTAYRYAAAGVLAGALGASVAVAVVMTRPRAARRRLPGWLATRAGRQGSVRWCLEAFGRVRIIAGRLASRRRGTLTVVALLELAFQAAAIAEVYATLVLLGVPGASLSAAFVLESINRIVTIVFKFVPLRLGVDELASGLTTHLLGAGTPAGIAVAVIRKGRVLYWSMVGLAVLTGTMLTDRAAPGRAHHLNRT